MALTNIIAFCLKNWRVIGAAFMILTLWYSGKAIIARHNAAIIAEVEARKDTEWKQKIDEQNKRIKEALDNVRKKRDRLENGKPSNKRDTIKLLRQHKLSKPA